MILFLCFGCLMGLPGEKKLKKDQALFRDAQKALDARVYTDAIDLFRKFIKLYPESKAYSWAFQRLGESFEGLVAQEYQRPVLAGEPEAAVRKAFLQKYGAYGCWEETPEALYYDMSHYRYLLKEFPDSPIADEAAYCLIKQEKDHRGDPEGYIQEIKELEQILEKYTSTTLRPEILFRMAHKCHILYEIYAFSPDRTVRDADRASHFRNKAVYLYKLTLKSPEHSKYSTKAWRGLELLERNTRIYRFE